MYVPLPFAQVLASILTLPRGRVTDYRTHITGLGAEDFVGVEERREDASRALAVLIRDHPGAVLVGHSLYHDLIALRLDYRRGTLSFFLSLNQTLIYKPY
jgi:hypothetical protein